MIAGVRIIELLAASWQELELDNTIWETPAARMKMRKPHLVPLSTQVLDLLNELKIMTGNYRYVLLGRNDPNKPMSEASVNQLTKRIDYAGRVAGHGFRHTFSTLLMILILLGLSCSWLMLIKIQSEVLIAMLNSS